MCRLGLVIPINFSLATLSDVFGHVNTNADIHHQGPERQKLRQVRRTMETNIIGETYRRDVLIPMSVDSLWP